jgi:adenylate kinase family enzyme
MDKILVIGAGGSGKSVLAARIANKTGLPLFHLDAIFWKPGWVETPRDEWRRIVEELVGRDRWVMDGNYGGTLDLRFAACDTVLFLDVPPIICLWRVLKRRMQFHNQRRPDAGSDCPERLNWDFLHWIWTYRKKRRPKILEKLAAAQARGKKVIVLRDSNEVEAFIAQLARAKMLQNCRAGASPAGITIGNRSGCPTISQCEPLQRRCGLHRCRSWTNMRR